MMPDAPAAGWYPYDEGTERYWNGAAWEGTPRFKADSAPPASASAGWYPDATKANTQRYWDGSQWTEHYAPQASESPQTQTLDTAMKDGSAAFGYIMAILLPFIGFLIGLALLVRGHRSAVGVMTVSVVAFIIWYLVVVDAGTY